MAWYKRLSPAWQAKLRSAARSLLFNVVVPLLLFLVADGGANLQGLLPELTQAQAFAGALVLGGLLRTFLPDVFGPRQLIEEPAG